MSSLQCQTATRHSRKVDGGLGVVTPLWRSQHVGMQASVRRTWKRIVLSSILDCRRRWRRRSQCGLRGGLRGKPWLHVPSVKVHLTRWPAEVWRWPAESKVLRRAGPARRRAEANLGRRVDATCDACMKTESSRKDYLSWALWPYPSDGVRGRHKSNLRDTVRLEWRVSPPPTCESYARAALELALG